MPATSRPRPTFASPTRAAHRPRASALGLMLLLAAGLAQARSFEAEGSDTGAGVGARWVAQGGTGVASADDVHAAFYNPAGLVAVQGLQLSVSRQLNAELRSTSFIGAAWRLPLPASAGVKATVAAAHYPRIHARASGAFAASDFESLFLRYLLPGINGTFDGDIDTKTKSTRLALGVAPAGDSRWSAGVYLERIDCKSNFCGVHATSNGFTTQSTGATATGVGLGLRWQATPALTLGAGLSDLRTRLTVDSTVTDDAGTRRSQSTAEFPRKWSFGAAWQAHRDWRAAADVEVMKGRYGSSEIDLQVLRLGAERAGQPWQWRVGAVVPLRIYSSASGTLKAPFPLAPTAGLGWHQGPWRVDLAVYAHAVMSMHADQPRGAADLSVSLAF